MQPASTDAGPDGTTSSVGSSATTSGPAGTTSTGSGADESSGTTVGATDTGDEPAPVECGGGTCWIECTRLVDFGDDDVCSCESPAAAPDVMGSCDPATPCGSPVEDAACMVQAIRYGIPGQYAWDYIVFDEGGETVTIEVLEPGRARGTVSSFEENACCGASQDERRHYYPFDLAPVDDASWDACLASLAPDANTDPPPDCLRPNNLSFSRCDSTPLDACPEPPPPLPKDATCAETCPMADDGVCDESSGSGLCADGCDPNDCGGN